MISAPEPLTMCFGSMSCLLNYVVLIIIPVVMRCTLFRFDTQDCKSAEAVLATLKKSKQTLSSAESCTGGLITAVLTSIPGSSAAVIGGVTAYSNNAKSELLGVDAEDIKRFGAVSRNVAVAMATGVRLKFGSDFGVSTTGIAGPDGGTPEKPVGLVWIAISSGQGAEAYELRLKGDRESIRRETVRNVLGKLSELLESL
jgi:PncC family amidohydrolase